MSTKENKAIQRRVYDEVWNKGNLAVIDELISDDYLYHPMPERKGPEWYKELYHILAGAFSGFNAKIEDMIAEGDKVMVRSTITGTNTGNFMDIAPTGKKISVTEIALVRIKDGKIIEEWGSPDMFSLMQQLGAIPKL